MTYDIEALADRLWLEYREADLLEPLDPPEHTGPTTPREAMTMNEPDGYVAVQGGRDFTPYVAVPEWIVAAGASPLALALYVHLRVASEASKGVRVGAVAQHLRVDGAAEVSHYLKELEALGAVTFTDDPMPTIQVNYFRHGEP